MEIKIIGVTSIGGYPNWAKWVIASIYNLCDLIIAVNGGIDWSDPFSTKIIHREQETQHLKDIDLHNKIIQIKPTYEQLKSVVNSKTEIWRGGCMTLSYRYAYKYAEKYSWKNIWLLKLDSDQIAHTDMTKNKLLNLANNSEGRKGFRFAQWSDFFRDYDHIQSLCGYTDDDTMTNDGALFFNNPRAWTTGQGSPVVGDQYPIDNVHTFHMRRIHHNEVSEWDYHYYRVLYHTWGPNTIMELQENKNQNRILSFEEIKQKAEGQVKSLLKSNGNTRDYFNNDERFPPHKPLVVKLGPLEYIKQGYPKLM